MGQLLDGYKRLQKQKGEGAVQEVYDFLCCLSSRSSIIDDPEINKRLPTVDHDTPLTLRAAADLHEAA